MHETHGVRMAMQGNARPSRLSERYTQLLKFRSDGTIENNDFATVNSAP
jgi:hypothetical protein